MRGLILFCLVGLLFVASLQEGGTVPATEKVKPPKLQEGGTVPPAKVKAAKPPCVWCPLENEKVVEDAVNGTIQQQNNTVEALNLR